VAAGLRSCLLADGSAGETQAQATHVVTLGNLSEDVGSIPTASTIFFSRNPRTSACQAARGGAGLNVSGFFFNLGRHIGRAAVPTIRKSKWIWDSLTGTEEEALRAEAAFGSALAVELRAATEPASDPQVAALVSDVCRRLGACVRDKRRAFRCEAIRADSPNAMGLPGGFVFVSDSLVNLCERRPDELAFVIGHEMAHVIRRHAWDRMLHEAASRAASVIAVRAGPLGGWLRQKGLVLLQSAHSQDSELEADELGFRLAAAAGFAPGGVIALLQRIERLGPKRAELGQYFASHPPPAERLARLTPLCRSPAPSRH